MTADSDKHDIEFESKPEPGAPPDARPPLAGGLQPAEVIDLRFILWVWLKWSWIALPLVALGVYYGVRDLRSFQPVYVATMTVAPIGGTGGGQISTVFGDLGISMSGRAKATAFDRFKVMLGSITLARRLQDRNGMLQVLFAESWDEASGTWIRPAAPSVRDEQIRILFHRPEWSPPNLETLAGYIGGSIKTRSRAEPGFVIIEFRNKDRDFALEFLTTVFVEADELLREQDRIDSAVRLEYINNQLAGTKLVNNVRALNSLLLSEQRSAMLLESGLPYAARVVEPAYVSPQPTEPNIRRVFSFPIVTSVGIGFLLLTLVAVFRRE